MAINYCYIHDHWYDMDWFTDCHHCEEEVDDES